jgi:hypothetical protein
MTERATLMNPGLVGATALSERDIRVLAFEREWWRSGGAKEASIRAEFGLGVTEYYQVLNALLDTEAALMCDPLLVRRLRRMRDSRQRAREARQVEFPVTR